MKNLRPSILLACLLFAGNSSALSNVEPEVVTPAPFGSLTAETPIAVEAHDWVAEQADNLCGISNLKRVTNPALVNYDSLLDATPQMTEMREKRIKPDSIEGKTLREAARKLIVTKAQAVQKLGGYDGLWKAITNKDGRSIDDVTADVIALF